MSLTFGSITGTDDISPTFNLAGTRFIDFCLLIFGLPIILILIKFGFDVNGLCSHLNYFVILIINTTFLITQDLVYLFILPLFIF